MRIFVFVWDPDDDPFEYGHRRTSYDLEFEAEPDGEERWVDQANDMILRHNNRIRGRSTTKNGSPCALLGARFEVTSRVGDGLIRVRESFDEAVRKMQQFFGSALYRQHPSLQCLCFQSVGNKILETITSEMRRSSRGSGSGSEHCRIRHLAVKFSHGSEVRRNSLRGFIDAVVGTGNHPCGSPRELNIESGQYLSGHMEFGSLLFEALKKDDNLTTLRLDVGQFPESIVADGLRHNRKLQRFVYALRRGEDAFCNALVPVLCENTILRCIEFGYSAFFPRARYSMGVLTLASLRLLTGTLRYCNSTLEELNLDFGGVQANDPSEVQNAHQDIIRILRGNRLVGQNLGHILAQSRIISDRFWDRVFELHLKNPSILYAMMRPNPGSWARNKAFRARLLGGEQGRGCGQCNLRDGDFVAASQPLVNMLHPAAIESASLSDLKALKSSLSGLIEEAIQLKKQKLCSDGNGESDDTDADGDSDGGGGGGDDDAEDGNSGGEHGRGE